MNNQRIINCLLDAGETIIELRNENEQLKQIIEKIKKTLQNYAKTDTQDIPKIIEFYQKLLEILGGDKE